MLNKMLVLCVAAQLLLPYHIYIYIYKPGSTIVALITFGGSFPFLHFIYFILPKRVFHTNSN